MRHGFRLGAAGLWLACAAYPRAARGAEPGPGFELAWSAPPGCPDEAWAQRAIRGYLGQRKLESTKPIHVRVEIAPIATGRFRAAISFDGGVSGDRRFEGASCARVGDAAVLVVALMFDPIEVVTQMEIPAAEARPPPAFSEVDRFGSGRAARSIELGLQATGDVGSLPEPTAGAGIAAGLRFGRASLAVDAMGWFSRRALANPAAENGGEIGLYTASVRGCFAAMRVGESSFELDPCVRAEVGLSSGRGFGVVEPTSSTNPWGAAFVGLSMRQLSTTSLAAWLSLEGGVSFLRPNYVIEDLGTVFRAGPLLGRVSFGLAWSFR
jgi:hypothetical protein